MLGVWQHAGSQATHLPRQQFRFKGFKLIVVLPRPQEAAVLQRYRAQLWQQQRQVALMGVELKVRAKEGELMGAELKVRAKGSKGGGLMETACLRMRSCTRQRGRPGCNSGGQSQSVTKGEAFNRGVRTAIDVGELAVRNLAVRTWPVPFEKISRTYEGAHGNASQSAQANKPSGLDPP
eukprot:1161606-Pelagomonas_calceolata.AAC.9